MNKQKAFHLSIFFLIIFAMSAFQLNAQMSVAIDYGIFMNPEKGPYVEAYLLIPASSVTFAEVEDGYQASVEVKLLFKENEEVKTFDKFQLNSKVISDPKKEAHNLVDLKRFFLPNGIYNFEVEIVDKANAENKAEAEIPISIDIKEEECIVSDILLVEEIKSTEEENIYTRGEYDMVPNVIRYYSESMDMNSLRYYAEVYNSEKLGDAFLAKAFVSKDGKLIEQFQKMTKVNASFVSIVYDVIDISDLASGNYELNLEIRDKKNELIAKTVGPFQRTQASSIKPLSYDLESIQPEYSFLAKYDDKEITEFLKYLDPIIMESDLLIIESALGRKDYEKQRKILLNFWTNQNEQDPEGAFNDYMAIVRLVNEAYHTQLEPGYQTDRGYFMLRYGRPSHILPVNNEAGAVPYEVWTYDKVERTNQSNIKTVFYNPSYIANDYEVVHSEIRGEFNNRRWQIDIVDAFKNSNAAEDFDSENLRDSYGKQLNKNFDE